MLITKEQLHTVFPRANNDFILIISSMINEFCHQAGIDNKDKLAMFLANVASEIRFKKNGNPVLRESLNYRRKVLKMFSPRFRKNKSLLDKAMSLSGKAKQRFIAREWYGYGKKARVLGNTSKEDGWVFRGRGLIQVTGRSNTFAAAREVERLYNIIMIDGNNIVDGMSGITGGMFISLGFWSLNVRTCRSMRCTVNRINRGLNKEFKDERENKYNKILEILQ